MQSGQKSLQLAQSAWALGAGIFGFGLGAKWRYIINRYALFIIIVGAVIHAFGMFIMQMKDSNGKATGIAKTLWITAWICLIALGAIIVYLLILKSQ